MVRKNIESNPFNYKLFSIPKGIKISKMMTYTIKKIELGVKKSEQSKDLFKEAIGDSLFRRREYSFQNKDGKFLMVYGIANYRFDHKKTFNDFSSRFEDADIIISNLNEKRILHPISFINTILNALIWFVQILLYGYSFYDALIIIYYAHLATRCKEILKCCKKKYKFVVVYNDIAPDENFVIQYFQSVSSLTMTLQHGIFSPKKHIKSINDFGLEYTESISDLFLAWNQYTMDEAIKAGLARNKIRVLGMPKYINYTTSNDVKQKKHGIFGVMLNSSGFHEHNVKLIEIANLISQTFNLKYYLRYHPQLKKDQYLEYCGENYLGENDNHSSIKEYTDMVDFTIISSSSVFVDLVFLKHPTYRLIVTDDDTYSNVSINSFSNINEFCRIYSDDIEVSEELFKYLCTTADIYSMYRNLFNKYLGGV